jgi:O-Antigen ligase
MLMVIWPLPDTMALRNLLLLSGTGLGLWLIYQSRSVFMQRDAWPIWLLLLFFIWILVQFFFVTNQSNEHLSELGGVWLRTLTSAITGAAAGLATLAISNRRNKIATTLLLAGLCATSVLYLITYLAFCVKQGVWIAPPFFLPNYRGKPPIVVFVGLALIAYYLKVVEAAMQGAWGKLAAWGVLVLLSLFDFVFVGTKNGILIFAVTTVVFLFLYARKRRLQVRQRTSLRIMVGLFAIAIIPAFFYHVEQNAAWKDIVPNVVTAWDIDTNQQWKQWEGQVPLPTNQNGQTVDGSTYARVAWAHAGLRLIKENLLGYGLLHHSFGALAIQKWEDFHKPSGITRGATHSAWIDLTLGVGVPGLCIIFTSMFAAFYRSRRDVGFWRNYALWSVLTLLLIFLIEEVASDLYVEFLFFLIAFFLSKTLHVNKTQKK